MDQSINITETADEFIQRAEIQYNLLDFRLDDWCIWPILRFQIAMRLLDLPWTQISDDEKLNPIERIALGFGDLKAFPLNQSDFFILTSSSGLVDKNEDKYMDIYFDEIIPFIGKYFKLEHINNKQYMNHRQNAQFPSQSTTNAPYILAALLSKIQHLRRIDSLAKDISNILIEKLQVKNITWVDVARILRTYFWRKLIYVRYLEKIKPHKLLLINAYNNHAIVAAAKQLNIEVIEFQHGLVSAHHPGYSWTNDALPFKAHMPIPNKLFLYGDYWKSELSSDGFWLDELKSVGSLRIDRYRKVRQKKVTSDLCTIVVTTQGLDITNLSNFLAQFMIFIEDKLSVQLYIKLHPREHDLQAYQEKFKGLPNVSVVLGSASPSTFDLLADADLHASISSTCHYEALALGIPTLILPFASYDKVMHLTNSKYAFVVESPGQMADLVIKLFHQQVPSTIGEDYFLSNALSNILTNLGK